MTRVTRFALLTVLTLALLALVAVGGFHAWSRQPFPQTSGAIRLRGLRSEVTIVRDRFGVPHIYADNPDDLFFAQGFVHAQDRFFQMEFWRRIGQGRLAELFGESALEQDRFIRTIGWHRVAALEVARLDADTRRVLESYAAGVNAYLATVPPDRLGLEFRLLGLIGRQWSPEPWQPVHSVTWGKVMAFNLGGNMETELLRATLIEHGGEALARALLPPYPSNAPYIIPGTTAQARTPALSRNVHHALDREAALALAHYVRRAAQSLGIWRSGDVGSNNWVVSGARTTTGKPFLANDPHLDIQMPSIWYQIGLHCRQLSEACPYDVVGVSFPGTPAVVLGHNGRIAWGVTNTGPDVQDWYIERPHPDNPDAFEFQGRFEPAQVFDEIIRVAGRSEPVVLRVRVTRHGPIMNDALEALKGKPPMALRWTALQPGAIFRSVLRINRARNWTEFRDALRDWDAPSQNFVYADVEGNIGYQMPGRIPVRAAGDGSVPVPGWSGEYEWVGEVPFEALPSAFNPPQGFIVTANNAVVDPNAYPHFLGAEWDHGFRARRILALLQAKPKLSLEDMQRIQNDAYLVFADDLLALMGNFVPNDADAAEAWRRLSEWDRAAERDSVGALIFETFWLQLAHALFDDELGDDEELNKLAIGTGTETRLAVLNAVADPNAPWWDDRRTPEQETREEILNRALQRTLERLRARFGSNPQEWRWGRAHQVIFRNLTLGRSGVAPIEALFNRGPFPVSGASAAINNNGYRDESFAVTSGPSWRLIADLANLRRSLAIHTTGQSGHAFHPHYDDMIPLWLEGRYNPLLWQREDVLQHAAATLVLQPQP